jgi:hypothetical protein
MKKQHNIPKTTPWGKPQTVKIIAPGIVEFTTASHGGIWLSPERNAQVPMRLKKRSFMGNGLAGWYEEDQDTGIVRGVFPECFTGTDNDSDDGLLDITPQHYTDQQIFGIFKQAGIKLIEIDKPEK